MIFEFTFIEIYLILGVITVAPIIIRFFQLVKICETLDKDIAYMLIFLIFISILVPPVIWYIRYNNNT